MLSSDVTECVRADCQSSKSCHRMIDTLNLETVMSHFEPEQNDKKLRHWRMKRLQTLTEFQPS